MMNAAMLFWGLIGIGVGMISLVMVALTRDKYQGLVRQYMNVISVCFILLIFERVMYIVKLLSGTEGQGLEMMQNFSIVLVFLVVFFSSYRVLRISEKCHM